MKKIKTIFSTLIKIILLCIVFFIIFILANLFIVGEKKTLNNNFTLTLNSFDKVYISRAVDDFEDYLVFENINESLIDKNFLQIDIDNSVTNTSFENFFFYGKNGKESLGKLKMDITKKYGGDWEILNNISIKEDGDFIFSSNLSNILFNITFDFNEKMTGFGICLQSDSELIGRVSIDYVGSNDNYAISIKDRNNDSIIYMKNNDFSSYKEAWDYYIDNKNSINNFVYGEDSVIFKTIEIDQLGLYEPLTNIKIGDKLIQNYYLYSNVCINGLGIKENSKGILFEDTNIKYNFMENSIIFIVKDGEKAPYFAYKY